MSKTVTITAAGGTGNYQYSIDGSTYQSSNTFTEVAEGDYYGYVKDENNCEASGSFNVAPSNYQFDWENNKHWRSEEFVLDPHADMGEGYVHYERNFYDFTSSTEVTFTMIFHMYITPEKATELGMQGYDDGITYHQIAYDLTGTYTVDPLNGIMSADFSSSSWHKLEDTFPHTTRTNQGNDLGYYLDVSQTAVNAGSTTGIAHFDDNPEGGPQPLGTSIADFERVNHPAHIDGDPITFPTMAFSYAFFEEGFGDTQQT